MKVILKDDEVLSTSNNTHPIKPGPEHTCISTEIYKNITIITSKFNQSTYVLIIS